MNLLSCFLVVFCTLLSINVFKTPFETCCSHAFTRVKPVGSGGVALCLETEDVAAAIAKAVSAGAVAEGEIVEGEGACCGGSVGKVTDPYGFSWLICSPAKKCAAVDA